MGNVNFFAKFLGTKLGLNRSWIEVAKEGQTKINGQKRGVNFISLLLGIDIDID
jgi:hypothetical protein